MKRAYLVRHGAYGDHIHMSNVIKALDEDGWHITFEYNLKGAQIHARNPRIDKHNVIEPYDLKPEEILEWGERLKWCEKEYDLFVDFSGSLENALIESEKSPGYFMPLIDRRRKNTNICYYDQSMKWAGLTAQKYMGWTGEVYFRRDEHEHVLSQLEPYYDRFIILWAMRGTMWQKAVTHLAKDICNDWIRRHPKTTIITTGDDFCRKWEWAADNGITIAPDKGLGYGTAHLIHKSGRMPFRQALNIARYADLVVTPETGLGIGAGVFGTPKIMLLTAASLKNIVGNDKNDFSLQSEAYCSPCTRAIYNTDNCPINHETNLPICVDFDKKRVLDQMEKVYQRAFPRKWELLDKEVYV